MRIISNFKDYYDFAGFTSHDRDYKDHVYVRKAGLKVTDAVFVSPRNSYYGNKEWQVTIISKWWEKHKKMLSLPEMPNVRRTGCLFVCGKAYPFIFFRDTAQFGSEGNTGQIKLSLSPFWSSREPDPGLRNCLRSLRRRQIKRL